MVTESSPDFMISIFVNPDTKSNNFKSWIHIYTEIVLILSSGMKPPLKWDYPTVGPGSAALPAVAEGSTQDAEERLRGQCSALSPDGPQVGLTGYPTNNAAGYPVFSQIFKKKSANNMKLILVINVFTYISNFNFLCIGKVYQNTIISINSHYFVCLLSGKWN